MRSQAIVARAPKSGGVVTFRARNPGELSHSEKKLALVPAPPENPGELSQSALIFEAAERRRLRGHVSKQTVMRIGRFDHKTLKHPQRMRPATARRWAEAVDRALAQRKGAPDFNAMLLQHRAAMIALAQLAGLNAQTVLRTDFDVQRPKRAAWLAAAQVRRAAIWLCCVRFGIERVPLARAIACSRQNIKRAIDQVEELRAGDKAFDGMLRQASKLLGAPA